MLTFCLMTNHVHLLVRTPEPDLGAGFKRINEDFARSINARYDLEGHLFGGRFYNGLIETTATSSAAFGTSLEIRSGMARAASRGLADGARIAPWPAWRRRPRS